MFRRLIVANRGEVAVRVARTCRRMGVAPVAVYSEADAGAPWLDAFESAVCIGPAHPARSYLDQDAILQAAEQEACQALHPGWGFLAENALFAARVRQQGLAWVGPPPSSIRKMGDKVLARQTAKAAGLPTIPGSEGLIESPDEAARLADDYGFPVLLKATAGGGGKGMRICRDASELAAGFADATREAAASFGNPGLYLEKFIASGRHIEFQVLADGYGNAIHLGERECSIQRRHQKLVEEAPSPVMDDAQRAHYGRLAADAAAAIGYEGAGTVEMLRDQDGKLYFMEMNTRLQVEHPVTEEITGIDLVEHQLRIAANEPLSIRQSDVIFKGHAIEARINAEEVADDFRPAPGHIERFAFPEDKGPGSVRVDTHIAAPCDVPPFYDSLVAKVIARGETRDDAIETLRRALESADIAGVPTTIPAHLQVLADTGFRSGEYDTGSAERMRLGAARED
jgi:acetyl-CoA carboxylase biotin carboxylase subunit